MIAGDQYERAQEFAKTKNIEYQHMPSMVVCPSTLTRFPVMTTLMFNDRCSHWKYEIEKFCDGLKICLYAGPVAARRPLRPQIATSDIVILSYDVLRNEIDDCFSKIRFNYCVLDEGHVIKVRFC